MRLRVFGVVFACAACSGEEGGAGPVNADSGTGGDRDSAAEAALEAAAEARVRAAPAAPR